MSDINSSLIGFLKKKSLFENSPDKSGKLRDRSKEKKDSLNSSKNLRNPQESQPISESPKKISKNTLQEKSEQQKVQEPGSELLQVQTPILHLQNLSPTKKTAQRNFKLQNRDKEETERQQQKVTSLWTGLVNHPTTFQSARLESAQCLDNLNIKIQAQISTINHKIDSFHKKMSSILSNQFASLKQKITHIVNNIFEQSDKNIKIFVKEQQEILAQELLSARKDLSAEFEKIQIMREDINKPQWRKVAGELLSSDLETKVEEMLVKSRSIDVKQWEVGDLGSGKVALLQSQLREIVRLQIT